jgi:hypothetical protein
MGGAGAGGGEGSPAEGSRAGSGSGSGGGWGGVARPVGVYVIGGGEVRWEPAVDVNLVIASSAAVLLVGLGVARMIVKARRRRH